MGQYNECNSNLNQPNIRPLYLWHPTGHRVRQDGYPVIEKAGYPEKYAGGYTAFIKARYLAKPVSGATLSVKKTPLL